MGRPKLLTALRFVVYDGQDAVGEVHYEPSSSRWLWKNWNSHEQSKARNDSPAGALMRLLDEWFP